MGKKCVVPKCRSGLSSNPEKVSMFTVPRYRLKVWEKALPGKNRPLTVKDAVCAKHFRPSDIITEVNTAAYRYNLKLPKLAPDAVPSLFHIRGNYPLRRRASDPTEPCRMVKPSVKPKRKRRSPTPATMEPEPIAIVAEDTFKKELQASRQSFRDEANAATEEYGCLIESGPEENDASLKRFAVVEIDGVKKLVTVDPRLLVRDDELYRVFCETHLKLGHYNGYNMLAELEKTYQNILPKDVALFIRLCPGCNPSQIDHMSCHAESIICNDMAATCSVNFVNYEHCPKDGYTNLMIYQNQKTKFCLLKPLRWNNPVEIAENLADIFSLIGISVHIESNGEGTLWEGVILKLKSFWPRIEFQHVKTASTQILCDIQQSINKWTQDKESCEWVKILPMLQLEKNNTGDQNDGTPYEALFGATGISNEQAASSTEEVEDFEHRHFETVYSEDYFGETPMEAPCEKDPFAAIDGTDDTGQVADGDSPVFAILPKAYKKRQRPPEELVEEFKRQLPLNRKVYSDSTTLTKQKYDELLERARRRKGYFSYKVVTDGRGVDRLVRRGTRPIRVRCRLPKFFLHDDELFEILHYTHINLKHVGREKMKKELNQRFENIVTKDITTYLQLCLVCQLRREQNKTHGRVARREHSACSALSARCSLNFIDYEKQPDGDFKYILIYENFSTKFIMLKPLTAKEPEAVAYHLADIFTFLGLPNLIESPEDGYFINRVVHHLKFVWPDNYISYHRGEPSSNVMSINEDIRTWMVNNKTADWSKGLRFVQLMRNKDYHCEIQEAPYNALFGFADTPSSETNTGDTPNAISGVMSKFYPFRTVLNSSPTLTTSEETFKCMLDDNRRKNPNVGSLSKEDYHELLSRVKTNQTDLTQYGIIYAEGVQRLVQPSDTEIKLYVHDDELFPILQYIHIHTRHAGFIKIHKLLQQRFVNISDTEIKTFVRLCATCSERKNKNCKKRSSPETPMYSKLSFKCCLDIVNLESYEDDGYKYVMIYQNLLTNFCILRPLKTRMPDEVACEFLDVLTLMGACLVIESQEDCNFIEQVCAVLTISYSDLDLTCVKGTTSFKADIEDHVKNWMVVNDTMEWSRALPLIQLAWNRDIHEGTDESPYEQVFQ